MGSCGYAMQHPGDSIITDETDTPFHDVKPKPLQMSESDRALLARIAEFYQRPNARERTPEALSYCRLLGHYLRHIVPSGASVLEVGCGDGSLLAQLPNRDIAGIDLSVVLIDEARRKLPHGRFEVGAGECFNLGRNFDYILFSDTFHLAVDVQAMLWCATEHSHPESRIVANTYSALWRPLYSIATFLGLKKAMPLENWLSLSDVANLFQLADWETVAVAPKLLLPIEIPIVGKLINRWLAPLLPWLCSTLFFTARRSRLAENNNLTVSVVVPARNEAGNIENAVTRTPDMSSGLELIFIEGGSSDDTWDEIERVIVAYPDRNIRALRQTGKGKGNAVREAFAVATGDVLMILDADLTVPPEELSKFFDVIASGRAEFANGVRLVYPMEDRAMRFFNLCANKFFGIAFSWLLGQHVKDTLCGTKVLSRKNYELIAANRSYFGDFDPFGDFDLLFGAAKLNLKILDVPIRYKDRTYGTTNIQRWRHGAMLFRMLFYAARRLKFV